MPNPAPILSARLLDLQFMLQSDKRSKPVMTDGLTGWRAIHYKMVDDLPWPGFAK
jgi:hypothetical protein